MRHQTFDLNVLGIIHLFGYGGSEWGSKPLANVKQRT